MKRYTIDSNDAFDAKVNDRVRLTCTFFLHPSHFHSFPSVSFSARTKVFSAPDTLELGKGWMDSSSHKFERATIQQTSMIWKVR